MYDEGVWNESSQGGNEVGHPPLPALPAMTIPLRNIQQSSQNSPPYPIQPHMHANGLNNTFDHEHNAKPSKKAKLQNPSDLRVMISKALDNPSPAERDAALLSTLKSCTATLQAAEVDHYHAKKRLDDAKEVFDWAAHCLSGYHGAIPKGEKPKKRGRKRKDDERKGDDDYDERLVPPETGPLVPPMIAKVGGGLSEEQVTEHRNRYYQRLCGTNFEDLESYTPPPHLANLKNHAQLDEMTFIADHWDTGFGELDTLAFRRQHKNFYTKMKIVTENIGRRTGHHIRDLAGTEGRKAFCRYGKNGESLMYVALENLYDAMFEIHTLKGHRGWNSCKKLANLKYANLPQDQIRAFIETCPHCAGKRGRRKKIADVDDGNDGDMDQEQELEMDVEKVEV